MATEYVSLPTLEADGKLADCKSIKPLKRTMRERVQTMNKDGFIEKRPQYGLTVEVVENNNFSENPYWEDMKDGVLVIVYKNGKREVYPEAVCLEVDFSGYSTNGESTFTYEFMTGKPTKM